MNVISDRKFKSIEQGWREFSEDTGFVDTTNPDKWSQEDYDTMRFIFYVGATISFDVFVDTFKEHLSEALNDPKTFMGRLYKIRDEIDRTYKQKPKIKIVK